ncbi:GTP cyclohydrolase I FolE [bacterium]|nr:GTP cyclohydrolase I FolE [bacterium]
MTQSQQGSIAKLVEQLLLCLGEDPTRPGLSATPERVENSLRFLTSGYTQNVEDIIRGAIFEQDYDEMIVLRDIDLFSLCEHHLLPFYGKCHIAYIPRKRVIGLSKLSRIVDLFSRRLQIQERLTRQIATCLNEQLKPWGVAVVIEALHLCMAMRGVEKQNAFVSTSAMLGAFRTRASTRAEFLHFIRKGV